MLLRGPRRRSHQSRTSFQGMISEIDTSSVVDETESTKVTTESQMAECLFVCLFVCARVQTAITVHCVPIKSKPLEHPS